MESKSFLLSLNYTEELSIFIYAWNLIQDVLSRDSVIVKHNKSIINDIETSFWTTVTNYNTRKDFMGFRITDWSDECVNAVVFAIKIQICPNDRYVGYISYSANPELHRIFRRRMKDERLGFMMIMSLGLNSFDIWPMSQLSQCEPTNIFHFHGSIKELGMSLCT